MAEKRASLTERLRQASKKEHRISNSLVTARLVVTATDKRLWAQALASFWCVFAAVEKALADTSSLPELAALSIILPRVQRTAAFEADLATFYGPSWRDKVKQSPSAGLYLERIKMITKDSPHRLLAHAYTQHMALLAGGQRLRHSVRGTMQIIEDEPGTAIFEFQEPAKKLMEEYKGVVDKLEKQLGEKETQEVIEEHRLVFNLNNAIIRSFPLTVSHTVRGVLRLLPPEVMLLIVSFTMAFCLMMYTRTWINIDPEAAEFADPDFVST